MQQVQQSLQKGMNDVLALHRGQEYTPQAQQAVAETQQALNRQLEVERQAVNSILENELQAAASEWLRSSKKAVILFPRHLAIASLDSADYTSEVMKEMNRRKPVFPEVPKVTINRPAVQQPAAK
ncbi:MAG: hypothetical protein IJU32_04775 [Pyramidobacter sp.]|nr:hypothetical protein [Pyramidobacter sp.]